MLTVATALVFDRFAYQGRDLRVNIIDVLLEFEDDIERITNQICVQRLCMEQQ